MRYLIVLVLVLTFASIADARRRRYRRINKRPVAISNHSYPKAIQGDYQKIAEREVELMSRNRQMRHFFSAGQIGVRFTGVGTYPYTCTPHVGMTLVADARSKCGRYRSRYWR